MEDKRLERNPVQTAAAGFPQESPPDVEAFVAGCIRPGADGEAGVCQKLMNAAAEAERAISQPNSAKGSDWLRALSLIAKGLRRHTAENRAFRFFYFGQFQTRVELLEQTLERCQAEERILSVAGRKHFAPIMQMLYSEQVCRQKDLSGRLGIDRSNLSREMALLLESGLVDARIVNRFKYYRLTPVGRRYYDTYLLMKTQLETRVYAPSGEDYSAGWLPQKPRRTKLGGLDGICCVSPYCLKNLKREAVPAQAFAKLRTPPKARKFFQFEEGASYDNA